MAQPIWKGFISFGLVNIPIVLYSAEDHRKEIHFNLLTKKDHSRVGYEYVNKSNGKMVSRKDLTKGYEYKPGKYIEIDDEELKKIAGENIKMVALENFIAYDEIDFMDFVTPYYLVPDKKGEHGYVILREVLKESKKIGIGKVIIHGHQKLCAIIPYENALVLNILRFHTEIKKPSEFDLPKGTLKSFKISQNEINAAKTLVSAMSKRWKPNEYQDEYQAALKKWLTAKRNKKGSVTVKMEEKGHINKKDNVIDIADLLKKSLTKTSRSKKVKKAM